MKMRDRIKHAYNAFRNRDPTPNFNYGSSYSYRPDRVRFNRGNERSIVTSIYNRIALDVASVSIQHVQLDKDGRFLHIRDSGLNDCLNVEANIDQTGRAFIHDVVASMLDEGVVAVIPVDTTIDPIISGAFDIQSMRTARIMDWYPKHVRVKAYNDRTGEKEELILPKSSVAIIENPLYAVINEPSSTMQRLIRKLNLLDAVDEQSSSGKMDIIIQLPYTVKSKLRKQQAEERRADIERQLTGSKYGIAYADATERITQLNRPVENNLMKQVEYLTNMVFTQIGITQEVLNGSADEKTMLNYHNAIIEPILAAIAGEFYRKFLTKTARTQNQAIKYYRDPFKLVPVNDLAEISDKLRRNQIATSNEIRQIIGWKPSNSPEADKLDNPNLNKPDSEMKMREQLKENTVEEDTGQNGD